MEVFKSKPAPKYLQLLRLACFLNSGTHCGTLLSPNLGDVKECPSSAQIRLSAHLFYAGTPPFATLLPPQFCPHNQESTACSLEIGCHCLSSYDYQACF